ncbi:hypothetical protein BGZ57DRAFT_914327 [Hyaloscypha finlandica]|nr:hypothetical protein BGZ57DRAFT_914327 [Hyaloscypha finlandica]
MVEAQDSSLSSTLFYLSFLDIGATFYTFLLLFFFLEDLEGFLLFIVFWMLLLVFLVIGLIS